MQLAKRPPLISRLSWYVFGAAFLTLPLLIALDDVGPRLHPEISDGTSIAGASALALGLILSVLAPWFGPKQPAGGRFALSLASGFCWFLSMGIFLTFYSEWHSHRRHAREIERAFNERLLPAAAFMRTFMEREHRLPSDKEMEKAGWHISSMADGINIYRESSQWIGAGGTGGVVGRDFVVETRVPDWNLYYRSWDNKRIEANWP